MSLSPTMIRPEPADSPASLHLVARYLDELVERLGIHACCGDPAEEAAEYRPPRGSFLVVRQADQPVGCGAVRSLGTDVAEVKRMWVAPPVRGHGLGRSLLGALEHEARRIGYRVLRLDTRRELVEAVSLYRAGGYREVPDYNANPHADVWFEKEL